jgi:hypothetical protein
MMIPRQTTWLEHEAYNFFNRVLVEMLPDKEVYFYKGEKHCPLRGMLFNEYVGDLKSEEGRRRMDMLLQPYGRIILRAWYIQHREKVEAKRLKNKLARKRNRERRRTFNGGNGKNQDFI